MIGGHSIDDAEPKFGQAVIGEVHPERILTNAGLQPGDVLLLTKPLGTGAITTAVKHGKDQPGSLDAAVTSMCTLNDHAASAARGWATGCTDVTGFGLLGHLKKMVIASGVGAVLDASAVPALPGAREALAAGMVSGGTRRNREWVADVLTVEDGVSEEDVLLLADAQTSGGLLFGVPAHNAELPAQLFAQLGLAPPAVVGRVHDTDPGRIVVTAGS